MAKSIQWCCRECGSPNIGVAGTYNPNTLEVLSCDATFDECVCNECDALSVSMNVHDLQPVRCALGDGPEFNAWHTPGVRWNGWLDVHVTPDTHKRLLATFNSLYYAEARDDFATLPANNDGLISLNGYCVDRAGEI